MSEKDDQTDISTENSRKIAPEDKVLFGILIAVFLGIISVSLFVIRLMMTAFEASPGIGSGVGLQGAFIASLIISSLLTIVFALVAGEGLLGEFTAMAIFFVTLLAIMTIAIAVIL